MARLTNADLKYYHTHSMAAKVLRQRRTYHFVLADPSNILQRKSVRDYTMFQQVKFEVKSLVWSKCDKVYNSCYGDNSVESKEAQLAKLKAASF